MVNPERYQPVMVLFPDVSHPFIIQFLLCLQGRIIESLLAQMFQAPFLGLLPDCNGVYPASTLEIHSPVESLVTLYNITLSSSVPGTIRKYLLFCSNMGFNELKRALTVSESV